MPRRSFARVLSQFLRSLTDEDIEAIEQGRARLTVTPARQLGERGERSKPPGIDVDAIVTRLRASGSLDEGRAVLDSGAHRRDDLRVVAQALDLPAPKEDTIGRLRERILDATIGFRLRSNAIRGVDEPSLEE